MRRREALALPLALAGCGDDMFRRRPGTWAYSTFGGAGGIPISVAPGVPNDLRSLGLGSKLLAYYDVRPQVSNAQASVTLASTLHAVGASPPTVTWVNGSGVPRQCIITYTTGGALGTMVYTLYLGDSVVTGTSPSNGIVNIGNGDVVTFGAGTYATTHTHWLECVALAELSGLANASLTSTLAGVGARYEAYGLNGKSPALYFSNSALANENGVPALATGTDTPIEVWLLGETWKHISGVGASVMWGFSNQTDTAKSYLRACACGPTAAGIESRYIMQRRDSGVSPATALLTCDLLHSDLDPKVIRSVVSSTGNMHFNGMPGASAGGNLNRGVATTLNRFTVGGGNLGTTGFASANWWLGRFSALAITQPLTNAEALSVLKALA